MPTTRFKIDSRPVIFEFLDQQRFIFTNQGNGNSQRLLHYARQQAFWPDTARIRVSLSIRAGYSWIHR